MEDRAQQIRQGLLDDQMPGFSELTGWIQRIPLTWLPGLLAHTVQVCTIKPVFKDAENLQTFVKGAIDRTPENPWLQESNRNANSA